MYLGLQRFGVDLTPGDQETFRFLTEADWMLALEKAERRTFADGEALIEQDGEFRQLCIIEQGEVRVEMRSPDGGRVVITRGGYGQVFGEMSLLGRTGASASVIAEGEVTAHVITEEQLLALLVSVPGFATRFYHSLAVELARRLREANERFIQLGARPQS